MTRLDEGYTLLELLVAVAILSLMAVPMALSIQLGIHSWQTTHDAVSVQERDMLVRQTVANWLEAAYPFDANRKPGQRLFPFEGTPSSVNFASSINPDPRSDARYNVTLELAEDKLEAHIALDHLTHFPDRSSTTVTLLEGVEDVVFSFLDGETDPSNPVWVSDWQSRFTLPRATRMHLSFSGADRVWPDLIVMPAISEWSHCAFDEVSRTCRSGEGAG